MSDTKIQTWANGFGIWHARVPVGPSAAHIARHAIRQELEARGAIDKGCPLLVKRVEDFDQVANTVVYAEREN